MIVSSMDMIRFSKGGDARGKLSTVIRLALLFWICFGFLRKPCSGYKLEEITGSGIYNLDGKSESAELGSGNRTGIRM
ncbi:hypothetical protein MLD38_001978 [Melastoma candidum]|uniref:Uncharacterized protein n=1 Tax=Melastoma candidum TaxID=119954 RepID=A0ACB9SIY3_9MYRT|nr:hypothetical protein MLD38_001978 [Melastoma candidum]